MNTPQAIQRAPELETSRWFNTPDSISLASLKGKVAVIHAFQMLCPGCVYHGIPQATTIHKNFSREEVQVIGLHTVFEHHEVMTQAALAAFIQEYRITFPVAVDQPSVVTGPPKTMSRYAMQGTPTLIIIDRNGLLRLNYFGRMSDMKVGGIIGGLLEEASPTDKPVGMEPESHSRHTAGCRL
jgi:peroxiredoxin